jgi:hypothetical protein
MKNLIGRMRASFPDAENVATALVVVPAWLFPWVTIVVVLMTGELR